MTKAPQLTGLVEPANARTVLFVRGEAGRWTVEPAEGSPAIADVRRAGILPKPKVTGRVGGAGASRTLRYSVARVPGQSVQFVEHSTQGLRPIRRVVGGGRGRVRFTTSEGRGTKRTIEAEVVQDGLPRENVVVARFRAPAPRPGRPGAVRVRRRGSRATVTWAGTQFAKRYEVVVQTGEGERMLLTPVGRRRTVSFGGLARGEGATVKVGGITAGGRRGPVARARLSGSLRLAAKPPVRKAHRKLRR